MKSISVNFAVSWIVSVCLSFISAAVVCSQNLDLDDQTAFQVDQQVTFTVRVDAPSPPVPLTAFGFDVTFDPAILRFEFATEGELVANFTDLCAGTDPVENFCAINEVVSGRLRVGVIALRNNIVDAIGDDPDDMMGALLRLTFTVRQVPQEASTLTIENPLDDLDDPAWMLGSGMLTPSGNVLDVDGNGAASALSDGIVIIRFLFGPLAFPGDTLIGGGVVAAPPDCQRCTAEEIRSFLEAAQLADSLDVDGNGTASALSDGIVIIRFLFGPLAFPGDTLIGGGVVAAPPDCQRCTAEEIRSFLGPLLPP